MPTLDGFVRPIVCARMEMFTGCFPDKDDCGRNMGLDWQATGECAEVGKLKLQGMRERGCLLGKMWMLSTLEVEHQQSAKSNLAVVVHCEMGYFAVFWSFDTFMPAAHVFLMLCSCTIKVLCCWIWCLAGDQRRSNTNRCRCRSGLYICYCH